jgi:hypothetical protein
VVDLRFCHRETSHSKRILRILRTPCSVVATRLTVMEALFRSPLFDPAARRFVALESYFLFLSESL